MDSTPESPQSQQQDSSNQTLKLQVDFQWKKFKAKIADAENPSDPVYIADFRTLKAPHIIFKSPTDDSTIGTGTLHTFSIDADFELHGQKGKLKALKRWRTQYTHLSRTFSNENGSPQTMRWSGDIGLKTWDFVCMDEQQMPIAKFASNVWAVKKIGYIEFMGQKEISVAVRDEIVVTGLTLWYCMMLRANSIFSFFGALVAKPGPLPDNDGGNGSKLEDDENIAQGLKTDESSTSQKAP